MTVELSHRINHFFNRFYIFAIFAPQPDCVCVLKRAGLHLHLQTLRFQTPLPGGRDTSDQESPI